MNRRFSLMRFLGGPQRLFISFLALMLAPASALIWMGWRQLEQDRSLEERRIHERREQAVHLIVTSLRQSLAAAEQRLRDRASWQNFSAEDAWILVAEPSGFKTSTGLQLPYYPYRARLPEAPSALFDSAERDEFPLGDYASAIVKLQDLSRSADAAVQAGAELRMARNLRSSGQYDRALEVYGTLAKRQNISVSDGLPADLVARSARCRLLDELGRTADLRREAAELYSDLRRGRWQLDRDSYLFYLEEIQPWLTGAGAGNVVTGHDELASAIVDLWGEYETLRRGQPEISGTFSFPYEGGSGTLVWLGTGDRLSVLAAGPRYLEREWMTTLDALLESERVSIVLLDSEGRAVFGEPTADPGVFRTVRADSETNLPWTLHVSNTDPEADLATSASRGRLVLAGLALLVVVVAAGAYFMARAVTRELAVARLQSDFVAAVSHEFRTPLTSLRQITEMLSDGRVEDATRLSAYLQKQARATARLQRLVESLLDFGRMEAGAKPYRLQPLNAAPWLRTVVDEFEAEAAAAGHRIELHANGGATGILADEDALAHAVRNLLDNAVKYSPGCDTVWVDLARHNGRLAISVRDKGLGIPPEEQKQIFGKFVRGAASKTHGIKGTGVGLAMVQHIVQAHGGEVRLESEPGRGSVFTVLLPEKELTEELCRES